MRQTASRRGLLGLGFAGSRQPANLGRGGRQRRPRLAVAAEDLELAVDHDLLAVLEEEKGGHGGDLVLLRGVGGLLDVDLDKGKVAWDAVPLGELLVLGRDGLAGRAPGGEEVDDDVRVGGEDLFELREGRNMLRGRGGHGCCCCNYIVLWL